MTRDFSPEGKTMKKKKENKIETSPASREIVNEDELNDEQRDIENNESSEEPPVELNNIKKEIEEITSNLNGIRESFHGEIARINDNFSSSLKERDKTIGELTTRLRKKDLSIFIRDESTRAGFIAPDEVEPQLSGNIQIDEDSYIISGKKLGEKEALGKIRSLIRETATEKPYLVHPQWRGGSGAQKASSPESSEVTYNFNNPSDRKKFEAELQKKGFPLLNPIK